MEEPRVYTEQWEFYFKKKSYATGLRLARGTLGFESVLLPREGFCGGGFL